MSCIVSKNWTHFYGTYYNYVIPITSDAITIQNEPLHPHNNPSMLMLAEEQANFIKYYLGPIFESKNIKTKIIIYDHNVDRIDYPIAILDDQEARQYIDGSAFHLYAGDINDLSNVHMAHPDKNLYFTEQWIGAPGNFSEDLNSFLSIKISAFLMKSIGLVSSLVSFISISGFSETEIDLVSELVSINAIGWPTLTTSLILHSFFINTPETSLGTSESTLSVAISTIKSSIFTSSPTFFSQLTIVASSTLAPILGNVSSYLFVLDISQKYQIIG